MKDNLLLSMECEKILNEFITYKLDELDLLKFKDEPIRDKVLALLDTLCIMVYYPSKDKTNQGFHITDMPFANKEKHNFVYINTSQTLEKQVFTAAHELGHIWKADEYVIKKNEMMASVDREDIISRFAAVLLMPEPLFKKSWEEEFGKYKDDNGYITIANILKVIVTLMEKFFAPMKAVVYRLRELNLVAKEVEEFLLGDEKIPQVVIDAYVQKLISDCGFIQIQNPTNKKWIEGFAEKLDEAEAKDVALASKIEYLRKLFDFKSGAITSEFNNEVQIKRQEGTNI